jgi:hypothetical protein
VDPRKEEVAGRIHPDWTRYEHHPIWGTRGLFGGVVACAWALLLIAVFLTRGSSLWAIPFVIGTTAVGWAIAWLISPSVFRAVGTTLFGDPPEEVGVECPHGSLVPRWDDPADLGNNDKISRYLCEACGEMLSRDEGERAMVEATEILRIDEDLRKAAGEEATAPD